MRSLFSKEGRTMKKKNYILGIIALLLSAAVFFMTSNIATAFSLAAKDPGPRLFPSIAAGVIGICGIAVLLDKDKTSTEVFLPRNQWARLGLLYGIFIAYAVLIYLFGFMYPSIVMLYVTCTLFAGDKKIPIWLKVIYAVAISVAICYVFKNVFSVPLPKGILLK